LQPRRAYRHRFYPRRERPIVAAGRGGRRSPRERSRLEYERLDGWEGRNSRRPVFDIQMPNRNHQGGEYDRQDGACQLVHLVHSISPISDNAWWHENVSPASKVPGCKCCFHESAQGRARGRSIWRGTGTRDRNSGRKCGHAQRFTVSGSSFRLQIERRTRKRNRPASQCWTWSGFEFWRQVVERGLWPRASNPVCAHR
jgi:hypothetical protein